MMNGRFMGLQVEKELETFGRTTGQNLTNLHKNALLFAQ